MRWSCIPVNQGASVSRITDNMKKTFYVWYGGGIPLEVYSKKKLEKLHLSFPFKMLLALTFGCRFISVYRPVDLLVNILITFQLVMLTSVLHVTFNFVNSFLAF